METLITKDSSAPVCVYDVCVCACVSVCAALVAF